LEKAVTWVIITLIVVFDPMAVILLLASQISFQNFREREDPNERELQEFADAFNEVFEEEDKPKSINDFVPQPQEYIPDEEGDSPEAPDIVSTATVTNTVNYQFVDEFHEEDYHPPYPSSEEEVEELIDAKSPLPVDEPLFVQNEEQSVSDLWSKTAISKEEYFETSAAVNLDPHNDAPHPEIAEYINLVRSGKMALRDVPPEYLMAVKARM
jgi:hypothetical protein